MPTLSENLDGAIFVDWRARVLFATLSAMAMLETCDALRLTGTAVSIVGRPGALERLVASCRSAGGGGSVAVPRRWGGPLTLTVEPVLGRPIGYDRSFARAPMPAAVIIISDQDAARERKLELWRERFGLTPAEARFALEIIGGGGRRAAAMRFGISDSTARAHLSSIFAKTGTSRQSELVALLLGED